MKNVYVISLVFLDHTAAAGQVQLTSWVGMITANSEKEALDMAKEEARQEGLTGTPCHINTTATSIQNAIEWLKARGEDEKL